MADKVFIKPDLLQWARKTARMTEETAADKVPVSVAKLQEWEAGTKQPTIKQAQKLAKAYKRPFALFFLPDIPLDFQPLQDFRSSDAKALSTSSIFIIREIQQKQAWIRDANEENKESKAPFVGRFTANDNPVAVAKDILDTLGINPEKYTNDNPIKEWIHRSEMQGIFISQASSINSPRLKLDRDELKGFAIADPYAPFVFINSNDWKTSQLFTLVHELAHIWIANTGISNDIEPELRHKDRLHPVELFCNEVAANALIPEEIIKRFQSWAITDDVWKAAKKLGVSSFAFLVRAYNLKLITLNKYTTLKEEADTKYKASLREKENKAKLKMKEKKGGPNYYLLQLNKNSRLFTQTVLDTFRGGGIEPTQASILLNVKVNKFHKLEEHLYK